MTRLRMEQAGIEGTDVPDDLNDRAVNILYMWSDYGLE